MNANASGDEKAAIEALAVWECNRRARWYKENGGASSYFHECLPATKESYLVWATDVLNLIKRVRRSK